MGRLTDNATYDVAKGKPGGDKVQENIKLRRIVLTSQGASIQFRMYEAEFESSIRSCFFFYYVFESQRVCFSTTAKIISI